MKSGEEGQVMEKLRNAYWERFGNRPEEVGTHHLMGNEARSPAPLLLQPAPPLRRVAKPRSAHYRRCCCANRSAGSIQGPWASKRLSNHQPDLHFCLQPHRSRNQQKSPPSPPPAGVSVAPLPSPSRTLGLSGGYLAAPAGS